MSLDRVTIERIGRIFDDVTWERERQERLKFLGKFRFTCADLQLADGTAGLILGEEFGEVCRAVLNAGQFSTDAHVKELREELVQVAAVAVAWIEKLDKRKEQTL